MGNSKLLTAAANKRNEVYTQMKDIENEVSQYVKYFKNKVIYYNCDH